MAHRKRLDPRAMDPDSFEVEELDKVAGGSTASDYCNVNCPCTVPTQNDPALPPGAGA
jgi:hypothetical protein